MKDKPTTQEEFAQALGLSCKTISRVFNNDPLVKEATRERVMSYAQSIGYSPHPQARGLRLRKTFALGILLPNSPESFWIDLLGELESYAQQQKYHVIVVHQRSCPDKELPEVRYLLNGLVDGLIVTGGHHISPKQLRELSRSGKPILLLNRFVTRSGCHYLGTDSRTGTKDLTTYLIGLGHRRIAYIAGPEGFHTAEQRLQGFRAAVEGSPAQLQPTVVHSDWTQDAAQRLTTEILENKNPPTAIIAANDTLAFGAYLAIRDKGLSIPEDISLAGYSGDRMTNFLCPPLTTVKQPAEKLGKRAVEILLEAIDNPAMKKVSEEFQDELLIRESTSAPGSK